MLSGTWEDPYTANAPNLRKVDFFLIEKSLTWFEARDECAAVNGRLAQPDNRLKNEFIKRMLKKSGRQAKVWFGASQHLNGEPNSQTIDRWMYTDGSSVGFTNWAKGRVTSRSFLV